MLRKSSTRWLRLLGRWDGRSKSSIPTRVQMQNLTKVQLQTIDHMMDTWEEQIKSRDPSAMLSKLQSIPGVSPTGHDGGAFATFNPFQAYAQFVEQWQKAWASASGAWGKAGRAG